MLMLKQKIFSFGGIGALFHSYDIDIFGEPDPLRQKVDCYIRPVFDYEQVLVRESRYRLAKKELCLKPEDLLSRETIEISYPVERESRLDIIF